MSRSHAPVTQLPALDRPTPRWAPGPTWVARSSGISHGFWVASRLAVSYGSLLYSKKKIKINEFLVTGSLICTSLK